MRFNTRFSGVLLALSVWMSGCGSDQGSPPVLTHVVWPLTLPVQYSLGFHRFDWPDGKAQFSGVVAFEDPDGDVVLSTVTWQDCGSEPAKRLEILQEDLKGKMIGEIPFHTIISTDCPIGIYQVNLSATDGSGHTSNVLPVPYEIYESLE